MAILFNHKLRFNHIRRKGDSDLPYANKDKNRLHSIWRHIKYRCLDKTNYAYKDYGGRGITLCEKWQTFEPFYKWALSNGYREGLTLDRINNDGNYEPSNCRWATWKEQGNNRRTNVLLTFKGKTKTLAEWADDIGVTRQCLFRRINVSKMPIEIALTAKKGTINHRKKKGEI